MRIRQARPVRRTAGGHRWAVLVLALVVASGCKPRPQDVDGHAATEEVAPADGTIVDALGAGDPAEAEPATQPAEIHYDLTAYDWYRRGEPLVHAGRSYRPIGPPVPSPAEPLTQIGSYGGVSYYAVHGGAASADTVYVPVFEGFWLRFRAP